MRLSHFAAPLTAIAAALMIALPAAAETEARISADFQKKLDKTYGVREAQVLKDDLVRHVDKALSTKGQTPARVVVTIEDAAPNRPTFRQLSDKPGLDAFRSISIGGANVSGVAYDATGKEIGSLTYRWYESDVTQSIGRATWSDATWVFQRFANRFADKLNS